MANKVLSPSEERAQAREILDSVREQMDAQKGPCLQTTNNHMAHYPLIFKALATDDRHSGTDDERARCLAIAQDLLTRGPGFPASPEFCDGYSLAAQELAAGIRGIPAPEKAKA